MPSPVRTTRRSALARDCLLPVLAAVALLITAIPHASRADGIYIPEIAHPALPKVPRQTALIAQQGETQTWIIESPLDAQAQSLGWIIPLPAVPDKIEKTSPGILRTLETVTAPKMIHDQWPGIKLALLGLFVATVFAFNLASPKISSQRAVNDSFAFLLLLFLLWLLFPALAGSPGPSGAAAGRPAGAAEIRTVQAGSYEVTILKANAASDLAAWLKTRGLAPLPETAAPILASYISQGWVLAAIHLTRSAAGLNAPHPIRMAFKSQEPVYPLKLTSLNADHLPIDLFLLADHPLACPGLRSTFSDTYQTPPATSFAESYFLRAPPEDCMPVIPEKIFHGKQSWIVHPDLATLAWEGCWLTRIEGRLSKRALEHDLSFHTAARTPHRRTVFSAQGAWHSIALIGIALLALWALVAGILERCRDQAHRSRCHWLRRALSGAAVLLCLATVCRLAMPVAPVGWTTRSYHFWRPYHHVLPMVLRVARNEHSRTNNLTIEGAVRMMIEGGKLNFPTRLSDDGAPGDITVIERDGRPVIRFHDQNGLPIEIDAGQDNRH